MRTALHDAPSHTIGYVAAHGILAVGTWGLGLAAGMPALVFAGLVGALLGLAVGAVVMCIVRERRKRAMLAQKVRELERAVQRFSTGTPGKVVRTRRRRT